MENEVLVLKLEGRIDSANAGEVEKEIMEKAAACPGQDIEVDAENLEYISSAGLRVLMKLRKQMGRPLPIRNVSGEIYEILEVTGFTELFDVKKRLREISTEGCDLIGSGGYGRVYRMDADTIVKVYSQGIDMEMVQHERDTARKAFLAGVPTAISYDVIRSGDCYGVVFELVNARTVAQIMDADRSRVEEMGEKSARLLKSLHGITLEKDALPNKKQEFLNWLPHIGTILEPDEVKEIRDFILSVPDRNTFLHGDFNSKNIMVQENGEFILIDIGDAATGHPVFDVAGLILPYLFLPKSPSPEEERRRLLGFRLEDGPKMWNVMCRTYFGLKTPEEIQEMTGKLMPYAQLMASYQGSRRMGYNRELMIQRTLPGIRTRLLPLIRAASPIDW